LIAVAIVISTPVQAGEEIGWRGYALPRLAARVGFARASLVLGVFWACWHLPLFFVPALNQYGQSFPLFMLGNIALSVAMTWLYVTLADTLTIYNCPSIVDRQGIWANRLTSSRERLIF
jgi:membrane protease YdiL (CAAX protease family)